MKYQSITAASAAASLTGFASNVTGATWTLTATNSGDGLGHKVTIRNDSATNHSAKTAALVGTDPDGRAQTETMSLPDNAATTTSTKYWGTLTSITPSATIGADTMDIGWAVTSSSPSTGLTSSAPTFGTVGCGCTVDAGSPTYSIQTTYNGTTWITHSTITGKVADFADAISIPALAARLNFTAAGTVTASFVIPHK